MGMDMPKECQTGVTVLRNTAKGGRGNQKRAVKSNLRRDVRGVFTLPVPS